MEDDLMLGDTPKARQRRHRLKDVQARGRLWKHSRLADLEGLVRAEELDDLFIFTLVRNPWDRMVSYYHWLQGQSFDHPAVALARDCDFETFVLDAKTRAAWQGSSAGEYVRDASGRARADLFIRIEAFEVDAQPLWDHLGFELELPHCNASERARDYRVYYTAASQEAVAQSSADDIERFGYAFDSK